MTIISSSESHSNVIYKAVVNNRLLQLREEVVAEFENLGFRIMTNSYFLHEATIQMGYICARTIDDEEAKRLIRPIVKRYVIPKEKW